MTETNPNRRQALRLLTAAPIAAVLPIRASLADRLVVTTSAGQVRGAAAAGIRVFTGIPYGCAVRFGRPQPALRWPGVLDATRPAKLAPQPPDFVTYRTDTSEDCLQLNIWTPAAPGRYPVLVYIHGGGNETGWSGDPVIAGDRFAAHDVICVTVNYRVGAFGFLELGEALGAAWRGSGNNGIRDLLLALHWVKANIAAFDGDPGRVTIAGGSAGGKNVAALLGMPKADSLYRAAAIFSGGAETVHTMAEGQAFARLLSDRLGGAERLLSASIDALLAAQGAAKSAWPRNFPFRPVVDGTLLPDIPLQRIRAAAAPDIPLLVGSNADESRLFLSPEQAEQPSLPPRSIANENASRVAELDRRYAAAFPQLSTADRHWRLLTAEEYGMPCLRIADGHAARNAPVYRYRLTYPAPGGSLKGHTPHALDVPLMFEHLDDPAYAGFFGFTHADRQIAEKIHGAVASFVRTLRPSAPSLPLWPRFDLASRKTMLLGTHRDMVCDPDLRERVLWLS